MAEAKDGCVKPAKGPIGLAESKTSQTTQIQKEEIDDDGSSWKTSTRF